MPARETPRGTRGGARWRETLGGWLGALVRRGADASAPYYAPTADTKQPPKKKQCGGADKVPFFLGTLEAPRQHCTNRRRAPTSRSEPRRAREPRDRGSHYTS